MRMSYRVVRSLEEPEDDIVEIELPLEPISYRNLGRTDAVLTVLWYPMRFVHSPSMPQKGMSTVKKLVNKNMLFVLNLKYFWIYQNPKVDAIEQAA